MGAFCFVFCFSELSKPNSCQRCWNGKKSYLVLNIATFSPLSLYLHVFAEHPASNILIRRTEFKVSVPANLMKTEGQLKDTVAIQQRSTRLNLQPNEWENTQRLDTGIMSKSFAFIKRFFSVADFHSWIYHEASWAECMKAVWTTCKEKYQWFLF